jgi:hypothetical protein
MEVRRRFRPYRPSRLEALFGIKIHGRVFVIHLHSVLHSTYWGPHLEHLEILRVLLIVFQNTAIFAFAVVTTAFNYIIASVLSIVSIFGILVCICFSLYFSCSSLLSAPAASCASSVSWILRADPSAIIASVLSIVSIFSILVARRRCRSCCISFHDIVP